MIKASSLFYAIVISLIIAIVSSSLIVFAYLSRIQFENFEMNLQLNLNADSGLNLLLSKQTIIGLNDHKIIDLYGAGEDNVELIRRSWGAYEVLVSKTQFQKINVCKIAQVGYLPDSTHSYSLYLLDEDKPLAVCGNTLIKGTAFLPKAGIKRAYIEGQNFTGKDLVLGQMKQSDRSLPEFNKGLLDNIRTIASKASLSDDDSIIVINGDLSNDSIINSFRYKSIVLKSSGPVVISEGFYSGNILIVSEKKITVASNAILRDVILSAPDISIKEGFRGNIQAFATDSLLLEKNVTLIYPSVLGLIKANNSLKPAAIVLSENDSLSGSIFAVKDEKYVLQQAGVVLKKKAIVNGQIYSNGYSDIEGVVYGSLMSARIILTTTSSVYENHLLNATVDRSKLSHYFVGINLVEESKFKKIIKWLN